MSEARRELKFQDHIVDSYKLAGGHARKWATDLQVGMPDLICSLKGWGIHLVEVKHRPAWKVDQVYGNPLTEKQKFECAKFNNAGGFVYGFVVFGSTDAIGSHMAVFDPTIANIQLFRCVPYIAGKKYCIRSLLGATLL